VKLSGITRRWTMNALLVVIIILFIFTTVLMLMLQSYYYDTVSLKLSSQYSDSVSNFFSLYTGGTEERFEAGAREFVENFSQKDSIEIWIIDKDGNVTISTSGFSIEDAQIPEYNDALKSKTNKGEFKGKTQSGEKIMAMTFMLPSVDGENSGAIRYMISVEEIDRQLVRVFVVSMLIIVIIISLVTISGMFFIQSIVNPVREINETAKKIAKGDLGARIESRQYDDEIGELCETINYMASEISATDKMRNDFISTVSHEMRTPLTAIKGWGETLLQVGETDPSLTKRGIEVIINESTRLTGVVEDLLDLSKLVNGRLSLRAERIDVLAELDEAAFVFKDRSMREGVELIYNVPHTPAPMDGDPNRIRQVFVNILDNAFKYTPQGGKINVYAEIENNPDNDEKQTLKIYVEDTGCGIATEDLPRIREKFYKSNISVRGSGIGLAVCDEMMKLHDGKIDIKSELDKGTLVILSLPIDKVELIEDMSANILPEEREIQDE
jgi:signal transduction histidine kinase